MYIHAKRLGLCIRDKGRKGICPKEILFRLKETGDWKRIRISGGALSARTFYGEGRRSLWGIGIQSPFGFSHYSAYLSLLNWLLLSRRTFRSVPSLQPYLTYSTIVVVRDLPASSTARILALNSTHSSLDRQENSKKIDLLAMENERSYELSRCKRMVEFVGKLKFNGRHFPPFFFSTEEKGEREELRNT